MLDREHISKLSYDELIELVVRLEQRIEKLEQENERLKRGGKRQAAPFSKGTRSSTPKRPGRKPGKGPFTRRSAPDPASITTRIQVELGYCDCPQCGSAIEQEPPEQVTITDLPELPQAEIRAYVLARGRCQDCGQQVRAEHPDVANDQRGATAHRLGPRLSATAAWLHYDLGVPQRRLPTIFSNLFGVRLTQSALCQAAQRTAERHLHEPYEQLQQDLSSSPAVNTDDTGWRVNAQSAWLMVFCNPTSVYYQIREQHRNEEVREVIDGEYTGVLITDRFRMYDAAALQTLGQQKCLAHVLRNLSEHLQHKRGRARSVALDLQWIFKQALKLYHDYHAGKRSGFRRRATELQDQLTYVLRHRWLRDEDNARLVNELGWHHDRGNLLRFLDDPSIEPTNNRAERDLRGAVIARKVSQCSKTWPGARTRERMCSIFATLKRRGTERLPEAFLQVLNTGLMPLPTTA
jgi:hypothetical protein